jgi:uncharacterized protein YciI
MDGTDGTGVAETDRAMASALSRLLGRDYWLIWTVPMAGTTQQAIGEHVEKHVAWMLGLEAKGVLFLSGPLLSGPGSGVTVIRADDQDAARAVAAADPFVQAGLRTFTLHRWRLNEGSVSVTISLGTGTHDWQWTSDKSDRSRPWTATASAWSARARWACRSSGT